MGGKDPDDARNDDAAAGAVETGTGNGNRTDDVLAVVDQRSQASEPPHWWRWPVSKGLGHQLAIVAAAAAAAADDDDDDAADVDELVGGIGD